MGDEIERKGRQDHPRRPRFTRTSAWLIFMRPSARGSDIVFLGALITYFINSPKWNGDSFYKEYLVNYTNAATLINGDYKDTDDLDGVFSGLSQDGASHATASWQYQRNESKVKATGNEKTYTELIASRMPGTVKTDLTLQDPKSVFQIMKKHYARYTPEMVERVCGCSKEKFVQVAEALLANSGRDRTGSIVYAVGWTQHTTGTQIIRTAGMVQEMLGNMGRPGGGILALRGHASIQGQPTSPPSTIRGRATWLLPMRVAITTRSKDYILTETQITSSGRTRRSTP